jgi:hypothetical protein
VSVASAPIRTSAWSWVVLCAGGIGGPVVWSVNMELGQILPYAQCGSQWRPTAIVSVLAAILSLAGAVVSWRARTWGLDAPGRTVWFAAIVSALMGVTFAFPLILQAASGVLLTGCER